MPAQQLERCCRIVDEQSAWPGLQRSCPSANTSNVGGVEQVAPLAAGYKGGKASAPSHWCSPCCCSAPRRRARCHSQSPPRRARTGTDLPRRARVLSQDPGARQALPFNLYMMCVKWLDLAIACCRAGARPVRMACAAVLRRCTGVPCARGPDRLAICSHVLWRCSFVTLTYFRPQSQTSDSPRAGR